VAPEFCVSTGKLEPGGRLEGQGCRAGEAQAQELSAGAADLQHYSPARDQSEVSLYLSPVSVLKTSVPDPKLLISDPDPQNQNQEFRIRILEPYSSVN